MTEKIACAIFSFDRPYYLYQTMNSIVTSYNKCKDFLVQNDIQIDFHFFQDGLKVGDEKKGSESGVKRSLEILKNHNKTFKANTIILESEANQGIAKQKYKANTLCSQYDNIMFFEDDMMVSPYYFRVLIALHKSFPKCAVTACDRTGGLPKYIKDNLHKATKTESHWWGYLMPKKIIQYIQPTLKEYIETVGDDYRKRPGEIIRKKYNVRATSHDAILDKIMKENGFKKIDAYVPRAKYLGEEGMHSNKQWFEKHKFNIPKQYIFEHDKNIETFELI